jgi:ABC-type multidrug transport system fused ATPase/permease subunit
LSDFGDGIGTAMEGALFGRAVSRRRSADDGHTHETECLNCGAHLVGPHCHHCGQGAHVHRTISAIFHDLLHGVLHFEGRTFNTLPMLGWRPGELTRRYIAGERRRFVSPMAMFLFTVFIMFALFQIMGISPPTEMSGLSVAEELQQADKQLAERRKELSESLKDPDLSDQKRTEVQQRITETDESIAALREIPGFSAGERDVSASWKSGWKRLDKGIEKWRKNPGLMLYKLQTNAYKFSWLLIPLSVPFVWIMFLWRRRFGLYDHAVFVTYSISFMSLMGIVATILGGVGVPAAILVSVFSLIACVHIYRQLRGAYELSRFSALWRTIFLLLFMIPWIIGLFATALMMLGLVG